jgi:hypothetical protein
MTSGPTVAMSFSCLRQSDDIQTRTTPMIQPG